MKDYSKLFNAIFEMMYYMNHQKGDFLEGVVRRAEYCFDEGMYVEKCIGSIENIESKAKSMWEDPEGEIADLYEIVPDDKYEPFKFHSITEKQEITQHMYDIEIEKEKMNSLCLTVFAEIMKLAGGTK